MAVALIGGWHGDATTGAIRSWRMTMQEAPIHCPADVDATEVEKAACETPRPVKPGKPGKLDDGTVAPQSGGGGIGNPPEPKPK